MRSLARRNARARLHIANLTLPNPAGLTGQSGPNPVGLYARARGEPNVVNWHVWQTDYGESTVANWHMAKQRIPVYSQHLQF